MRLRHFVKALTAVEGIPGRVDDRSYAARHSPEWLRRSGRVVNNPKIYLSQLYKACSTKILVKIELKMRACEKTTENLQILAKKGRLKTLAGYPRSQLQQAARGFPSFFKTKVEVVST